MNRPVHSVGRHLAVLAALLVLLAISAGSALIPLGTFNPLINMAVSVAKTLLVMAVFMHQSESRTLTKIIAAAGFVWLAFLIGLSLTDFLTRSVIAPPW
ncbi:MAG TPA: cytochrome C oxidase subunit IV family protein [Rhodanobacteraceae bacterium]|nr:cytochrome C oxidase subunit IV family protein [Rhodanobacteraceae bacterium]